MSVPIRRLGRKAVGLTLLVVATSLAAQEDPPPGNSPLDAGEVVISAGAGLPYYVGYTGGAFGSLWGVSVTSEFVIGRTPLWHPIELTFGAGAGASAMFADPLWWSAVGFASAHLFWARSFATYSRLGLGYFQWAGGSLGLSRIRGIAFWGAGGAEYFVSNHVAIYVEAGWLAPVTAGVRISL